MEGREVVTAFDELREACAVRAWHAEGFDSVATVQVRFPFGHAMMSGRSVEHAAKRMLELFRPVFETVEAGV